MWTSEQGEHERAINDIKYPKPKCKTPYCGKDTQAFNNGFCYFCTQTDIQSKMEETHG